jgi:hypothetical protein
VGTSTSLAEAAAKIDHIMSPATVKAMTHAAGQAAQKAGLAAAAASLGGDRRMSGLRRGGALTVDVDESASSAVVKYQPAGAWKLAQSGRRSRKTVRKGGVIFRTPYGPRWSFRSGPSRGLGTLSKAETGATRVVGKAADEALQDAIRRAL